jgi:vacuolar protein sorting-associated protein 18
MALDVSDGYAAASTSQNVLDTLPSMFNVERVQLQFNLSSDFVAGAVANNVLILALATGRILRIDLDNAEDVDGMKLAKSH